MDLQNFLMYAIITVLMAPLLVVYGIPFILLARVFAHFAQLWLPERTRFVLSCGVASLGIAPAYDIYRAPLPIYTHLLQGEHVGGGFMLVSFLVTWVLVVLQTRQLMHLRGHKTA